MTETHGDGKQDMSVSRTGEDCNWISQECASRNVKIKDANKRLIRIQVRRCKSKKGGMQKKKQRTETVTPHVLSLYQFGQFQMIETDGNGKQSTFVRCTGEAYDWVSPECDLRANCEREISMCSSQKVQRQECWDARLKAWKL